MKITQIAMLVAIAMPAAPVSAQSSSNPTTSATPAVAQISYADLADLTLPAPVVARATVDRAFALEPDQSVGVAPGHARLYVEATVTELVKGPDGMAPNVRFLTDLPTDSRGRPPRLKHRDLILFARPGAKAGDLQLVAPDALLLAAPDTLAAVRAIATDDARTDAPPPVTGIASVFHVAGTIAGDGETQIFLKTARGTPISLDILRRAGAAPRWGVAKGEIVDESAVPPARDTLSWYRLACFLPDRIDDHLLTDLAAPDRDAARADYALVRAGLGPCPRFRSPPPASM